MKPYKGLYFNHVKNNYLEGLIKPKWTWEEEMIPLSEDILIETENRIISDQVSEWIKLKEKSQKGFNQSEILKSTKIDKDNIDTDGSDTKECVDSHKKSKSKEKTGEKDPVNKNPTNSDFSEPITETPEKNDSGLNPIELKRKPKLQYD